MPFFAWLMFRLTSHWKQFRISGSSRIGNDLPVQAHPALDNSLSCGPGHCGITLTGWSITMQITSKGQVTIPQVIRNRLGLLPHTRVEFELAGDHARIRKARRPPGESVRARRPVEVRRGAGGPRVVAGVSPGVSARIPSVLVRLSAVPRRTSRAR